MKITSGKLVHNLAKPFAKNQSSLRDYHSSRNRILIFRGIGGMGDIFIHRMMFEDFHDLGLDVHFACPSQYLPAVADHPFLSGYHDCFTADPSAYAYTVVTTTACGSYESAISPSADLNRSDIWAAVCGVELKKHRMHIVLTDEEVDFGRELVGKIGNGKKTLAFCPTSAQVQKNLVGVQTTGVLDGLRSSYRDVVPFGLHNKAVQEIVGKRVPMVSGLSIRQWMGVMNAVDYAITVDTSAFHLAGGLDKPVVGIFTYASSASYSRHYTRVETVQGPCPVGHLGCYAWGTHCPVKDLARKPCVTGLTADKVLEAFGRLVERYPG